MFCLEFSRICDTSFNRRTRTCVQSTLCKTTILIFLYEVSMSLPPFCNKGILIYFIRSYITLWFYGLWYRCFGRTFCLQLQTQVSLILKMEAEGSSAALVSPNNSIRCQKPEDHTLNNRRQANLKSQMRTVCSYLCYGLLYNAASCTNALSAKQSWRQERDVWRSWCIWRPHAHTCLEWHTVSLIITVSSWDLQP
jgi:hypothetical protein